MKPYQPDIIGIPEDEDGLIPSTLESVLNERLSRGLQMPRVLYLIPTGNNPTGTVIPEDRRRQIYELACKFDFLILEDDPYMFLNYTEVRITVLLLLPSKSPLLHKLLAVVALLECKAVYSRYSSLLADNLILLKNKKKALAYLDKYFIKKNIF